MNKKDPGEYLFFIFSSLLPQPDKDTTCCALVGLGAYVSSIKMSYIFLDKKHLLILKSIARKEAAIKLMTDYYQRNYKEYHKNTFSIDPFSFLEQLVKRLTKGSLIIDVGCGSGRDLLWLQKKGFDVIGFERSAGLAALARENAGCKVIEGDFEGYDFSSLKGDAILASGSLVHVPHERLPNVFGNIAKALDCSQNSGYFYVSLKEGRGESSDSKGRTFYLWQDEELRALFKGQGFEVAEFLTNESAVGTCEIWLGYVLGKKE